MQTTPLPPAPQDPGAAEQTESAGHMPAIWQDNTTGEGAASALESLRKLEQSRHHDRAAADRPGTSVLER